jgi:hypothetical protein
MAWHTDPKEEGGRGWVNPGYHAVICNGHEGYGMDYSMLSDGRIDTLLHLIYRGNPQEESNVHREHG